MAIFLDSANPEEAKTAFKMGFVHGITTNPKLLGQVRGDSESVFRELCRISTGPVCYQLTAASAKERQDEAKRFYNIHPKKVILKIPCTTENLSLMAHLQFNHGIPCAATAVFSPAQGYLACEAGARYLIPYVNKVTAQGGSGPALVTKLAAVCKLTGKGAEVLAASLKTPEEVVEALLAGAAHVTVPFALLNQLGNHAKSDEAIKEFSEPAKVKQITPTAVFGKG
ncbi:MAG: transaldolase family protein [Thermoplasmatota archaeon]